MLHARGIVFFIPRTLEVIQVGLVRGCVKPHFLMGRLFFDSDLDCGRDADLMLTTALAGPRFVLSLFFLLMYPMFVFLWFYLFW